MKDKMILITILILSLFMNIEIQANNVNIFNKIPKDYQNICLKIKIKYDIPNEYLYALPFVESSWNPKAVSSANCIGLTQLNPIYLDYYIEMFWENDYQFDINNPIHNLEMGFAYLSYLKWRFVTWDLALIAYKAGPTRTAKWDIPDESIDYVIRINEVGFNL